MSHCLYVVSNVRDFYREIKESTHYMCNKAAAVYYD